MENPFNFNDRELMLVVKYSDLERLLQEAIQKGTERAARVAYDADALLSPEEVQKMLSISSATLSRWQATGYIHTLKVGGKRRFKAAEVRQIKEGLK